MRSIAGVVAVAAAAAVLCIAAGLVSAFPAYAQQAPGEIPAEGIQVQKGDAHITIDWQDAEHATKYLVQIYRGIYLVDGLFVTDSILTDKELTPGVRYTITAIPYKDSVAGVERTLVKTVIGAVSPPSPTLPPSQPDPQPDPEPAPQPAIARLMTAIANLTGVIEALSADMTGLEARVSGLEARVAVLKEGAGGPDAPLGAGPAMLNIGEVLWLESSQQGVHSGAVRVVDPDMNRNSNAIDSFAVSVRSDVDFVGIDLTVTETGYATGIFEGTVFFTTAGESSENHLRVTEGGLVTAEYEDSTLPYPYARSDVLDITVTTMLAGATVVPAKSDPVPQNQRVILTPTQGASAAECHNTDEGCFNHPVLTVSSDTEIIFYNIDNVPHALAAGTLPEGPSGAFESGLVLSGETYAFTLEEDGVYDYFCIIHPWMTGQITIQ